jgi:hypothetical protein
LERAFFKKQKYLTRKIRVRRKDGAYFNSEAIQTVENLKMGNFLEATRNHVTRQQKKIVTCENRDTGYIGPLKALLFWSVNRSLLIGGPASDESQRLDVH